MAVGMAVGTAVDTVVGTVAVDSYRQWGRHCVPRPALCLHTEPAKISI